MSTQNINYNDKFLSAFLAPSELESYNPAVAQAEKQLVSKTGAGNDFLGWLDLPAKTSRDLIKSITDKAGEIRGKIKDKDGVLISIGIGGSYLGAKAAIEFCSPTFEELRKPHVIFAGQNINSDYLSDMLELIKDREVAVNVISKSGTTTEPAIAFRIVREWMEKRYGREEAAKRIVATTDKAKGALRKLANEEKYTAFEIPDDVGGRFSVLTPVGLFPLAVAGLDIAKLLEGAASASAFCSGESVDKNLAGRYAAVRNILFRKGYTTEVMATFQPQLHYVNDWWKQLSGESEGKNCTGIMPAGLDYTTDLHSLGQYLQDGLRNIFETFMILKKTTKTMTVPKFADDSDDLNYLAGRSFEDINEKAFQGTVLAHLDGGVPAAVLMLADRSESTLGQLFYFFEKAVALSGYMLRVNPFDQPGVEAYKKNMFALLGKAGYEKQAQTLSAKTKDISI